MNVLGEKIGQFLRCPTFFSRPLTTWFFRKVSIKCCTFGQLLYLCDLKANLKIRTIIFLKDYFANFFVKQGQKVKDKIIWTFDLIELIDKVPETYLKHLDGTDKLFEIRVQSGNDIFRIFCFFDEESLVVHANGFQKKTQKTPKQEIEKALEIKIEYYESK